MHTSHRLCDHPHTPAARAACRKQRTELPDPAKLIRVEGGYATLDKRFFVRRLTSAEVKEHDGNRYEITEGAHVVDWVHSKDDVRPVIESQYE